MSDPVVFNNTVLRDGHQSLAATRMNTAQLLSVAPLLDKVGYGALETWGGATIDAGLRFLKEFPFDRLRALREATKTPHMMLLRGQNIVAYAHYPDDVVTSFVQCSARAGMDIFRIFDALNDPRNMQAAIEATKAAGKHAQGTICYTKSPVHTVERFVALGCTLAEMGCNSIVIKDMAGLIPPRAAYDLVKGLKKETGLPVWVHTHETAGLGASTYLAAIDAGVDAVDVGIVPFGNGTGQPDHGRMMALLEDHPRQPKQYDEALVQEIREKLQPIYGELKDYTAHQNEIVDTDALIYGVPGGMLSNFRNQLKELKMEDRFEEVFREIPVVREALGWIPLVTPTSQIVGTQAVMNVKFGRWKNFLPQAMDIALGYFGQAPARVDTEVQKLAAEKSGKDPITVRPADLQKPGMENLKTALRDKGLPDDDEHAVIHAMFPQQLEAYEKSRQKTPEKSGDGTDPVHLVLTINGTRHQVTIEETTAAS